SQAFPAEPAQRLNERTVPANAPPSPPAAAMSESKADALENVNRGRETGASSRYARDKEKGIAKPASIVDGAYRNDPVAWLNYIRQLRKDNNDDEADKQWQRFVGDYPDFPVATTDAARPRRK